MKKTTFLSLLIAPVLCTASQIPMEHKIGQMLMIGFRGFQIQNGHHIVRDIRDYHLGGVVLFDVDLATDTKKRNIQSPEQVKDLVRSLQAISPTPLFIAIDYEGGQVARLKEEYGFPPTVSAQQVGNRDDLAWTRLQSQHMAATLADLGINLNLAPVVDLATNPENPIITGKHRSYSDNPHTVVTHAEAFILAHHRAGILCTLKHFPGHGSSYDDSHLGSVDVTHTWSPDELIPYRKLINRGLADCIMTCHIFHARIDPDYPATLSKPAVTGILRGQLNFEGVVLSDDIQMGAISKKHGLETAVRKAIEAGVDILLFANMGIYQEDIVPQVMEIILRDISRGILPLERIEESYRRIIKLKEKLKSE